MHDLACGGVAYFLLIPLFLWGATEEENTPLSVSGQKLPDQVRARIRVKHYSIRAESQYVQWIRRFILFHGKRHPREMGGAEVEAFLSRLAVAGNVAAATQSQALAALLILYREVLGVELPWLDKITRAKKAVRLPTVLTRTEVQSVLVRMDGTHALMARLLYGNGMRLMGCCRLPVKDVDFERREILLPDERGRATTSAPCRNCSVIRMFRPR